MKKPINYFHLFSALFLLLTFWSCSSSTTEMTFDSSTLKRVSQEEVDKVVESFIMAKDGDVINIPGGFYNLKTQLILDNINNITIKGEGMEQTVLSFRELKSGGEGIKLVGNNIKIENLSVEDAPGDGIKVSIVKVLHSGKSMSLGPMGTNPKMEHMLFILYNVKMS
jgi:hypothetical protein